MSTWKKSADAAATGKPTSDYWHIEMKEFHKTFGSRIMLLAEQLRGCGWKEPQWVYDRERDEVDSPGMIGVTIWELWQLSDKLPKEEGQLQCANK
jgi:hypothetical protein